MAQPLGRAVGNALEVREAIETLGGRGPHDLTALSLRFGEEMLRLAGVDPVDLRRLLTDGSALRKLAQLIAAQSGDPAVVEDPGLLPVAPIREPVLAPALGHVTALDALEIALAAKALGAGRDRKDASIDLSVGIVLAKKVGDAVQVGEALAVIHAASLEAAQKVAGRVTAAFTIGTPAASPPLLLRRVTASGIERLGT